MKKKNHIPTNNRIALLSIETIFVLQGTVKLQVFVIINKYFSQFSVELVDEHLILRNSRKETHLFVHTAFRTKPEHCKWKDKLTRSQSVASPERDKLPRNKDLPRSATQTKSAALQCPRLVDSKGAVLQQGGRRERMCKKHTALLYFLQICQMKTKHFWKFISEIKEEKGKLTNAFPSHL